MGQLCLCPSFLNSGLLLLTSVGLLSLTSFRNPILQAVGLECGLLHFINLKKKLFLTSPITYSLSRSCALREGHFAFLLLSRVEVRAAFYGQRGLQSIATKPHGASLGLNQYLGSNHWAVYSTFSDPQTAPGALHRTDQFHWPEPLKAHYQGGNKLSS